MEKENTTTYNYPTTGQKILISLGLLVVTGGYMAYQKYYKPKNPKTPIDNNVNNVNNGNDFGDKPPFHL